MYSVYIATSSRRTSFTKLLTLSHFFAAATFLSIRYAFCVFLLFYQLRCLKMLWPAIAHKTSASSLSIFWKNRIYFLIFIRNSVHVTKIVWQKSYMYTEEFIRQKSYKKTYDKNRMKNRIVYFALKLIFISNILYYLLLSFTFIFYFHLWKNN